MKKVIVNFILSIGLMALVGVAKADVNPSCNHFFFDGFIPQLNYIDTSNSRMICYKNFAVAYNINSKSAHFVAERTNKKLIEMGFDIGRSDEFYEDARLPEAERAKLSDYRRTGYDRGHLSPSANAYDYESMVQSFSLVNIVPQDPVFNRKAWAQIEKSVRKYVRRSRNDIYIITGPLYFGKIKVIGNGVWVPSALYKGVYDPLKNKGWVFVMENTAEEKPSKPVSLEEFEKAYGIVLFNNLRSGIFK